MLVAISTFSLTASLRQFVRDNVRVRKLQSTCMCATERFHRPLSRIMTDKAFLLVITFDPFPDAQCPVHTSCEAGVCRLLQKKRGHCICICLRSRSDPEFLIFLV
jgi:hypothetical protein